ncbi:MAG: cupin domain-containing protein [Campylobacterota bacterium]|nr:cupin domain-containing protein [Campylobacterota bacterium]
MNLFDKVVPLEGEAFNTLLKHKNIKIVRIVSSKDLQPTTYTQEEDEWVLLIQGQATLTIDNKKEVLSQGESLFIPALTPHSVEKVEEGTIWLAVHIY